MKYSLVYSDGKHYNEYVRSMTLEKAKEIVSRLVARHFAGKPTVEYIQYGDDYEAVVRYPIKDDDGHKVADIMATYE